jgi:glycosyltransferase involved in cell wall biosynthesis
LTCYVNKKDLNIKFIDHVDDVSDYMANLDIFVMPSYKETFGIVLIEAMSSKTCVVSTNAGGVPEILDFGKSGKLVEPKSVSSLANGLRDLILNPKMRNNLAHAGYKKAKTFYNQEVMITKWLEILS